jgi:2-dehydro-3-deoxy-D-arabinonate dehydratase
MGVPLCRYVVRGEIEPRFGLVSGESIVDVAAAGGPASLAEALQLPAADLSDALQSVRAASDATTALETATLVAPIDRQEVWAAGVTYLRSRDARMEESTQRDIYDRVYDAERPEIFLKATPNRVAGPGEHIGIRGDSSWDVPEPELTVVLNALGEVVGYTIGNDVSSRSIEGENPLYLPQAKVFSRCAALGPVIVTTDELADVTDREIRLIIRRAGAELFADSTSTARMHRTLAELCAYVFRCNEYQFGLFVL